MRILSLTNCPLDPKSGSGKTVLMYSKGLQNLGHSVDVAEPKDYETWHGIGRAKKFRQAWGAWNFVKQKLRITQYGVIEFYGDEFWLATWQLSKLPKRPLLVAHTNGLELIDRDRLESVNLNRLPAATQNMATQQWYKVDYVKHLIKRIYATGSCVKAIPASIADEVAKQEVAVADLIVVATDNHSSRQVAQELALAYMRPLVCLGTHIDLQPNHTPRMYCRITVPPLGGGLCLMCGNIINLHRAALESAADEINHLAARVGYLEGIGDPAVFWLNSLCASTGVGIIHSMLSGFLNVDNGLDWIYEFPGSNWLKANTDYLGTCGCYFCGS